MTRPTFASFGAALHHDARTPYRWQQRAADELATGGWWPAVRAPTGSGKTTLIDCWLHALAVAGPDRLGRRLVWVVDRRSVVDQIFQYASDVVDRLVALTAPEPVRVVAQRLQALGGGAAPRAVLWRGGLDDEGVIAMRDPLDPAAITIVVSTVDQLGSRLLFRGYGMAPSSRALHAGLLGVDTTVVLDEAHISEPLRRTVARVGELQRAASAAPRPPLRLCAVSATHSASGAFELLPEELREPAIAHRVEAAKPARLAAATRPAQLVKHVQQLVAEGARVIGVVMNTVGAARAAFEGIAAVAAKPMEDRILLIGPVRPLERLDLLAAIPQPGVRSTPFVVVATQTIEVGVDLDFDALVTECAPLDALVQRFGRLNRSGRPIAAAALILPPPTRGCPVYGAAAASTWTWLQEVAGAAAVVDFGVEALRATVAARGKPAPPVRARTIKLAPEHITALQVTDASEHEGPAIELFLHGDRAALPQVSLAWRASISDATLEADLELRPLHPGEAISLSFAVARRWLRGEPLGFESDIEAPAQDETRTRADSAAAKPAAWRIDTQGDARRIDKDNPLRPGDQVVVDASAGGLDGFGWSPGTDGSVVPVIDLGSISGRAPAVVLSAGEAASSDEDGALVAAVGAELESGEITAAAAAKRLAAAINGRLPSFDEPRPLLAQAIREAAQTLQAGRATLLGDGRILVSGHKVRTEHGGGGAVVTLEEHQRAVAKRADRFASAVGLSTESRSSLIRAARHHDEGKRDPRFQAWLRGGSTVSASGGPLAKSAYPYDPVRVRRLRDAAGWPKGKRHELVSAVAVALAHPEDELAAWLAATHHGRNRPFCLAVEDPSSGMVEIALEGREDGLRVAAGAAPGVAEQLRRLVVLGEQFGPWGLAYLEALLICADRAVSAEESAS